MQPETERKHHQDASMSTLHSLHSLFYQHIFNASVCVSINYSILKWLVFEQAACLGVETYN